MLSLLLYFVLGIAAAPAQVPVTSSATASLPEDPVVTALARKIYSQMRAGKVDDTLLTPAMNKELSPGALARTKPIMDQLGEPVKLTLESGESGPDGTRWVYLAAFKAAQLHVHIFVTPDGKVGGYELAL